MKQEKNQVGVEAILLHLTTLLLGTFLATATFGLYKIYTITNRTENCTWVKVLEGFIEDSSSLIVGMTLSVILLVFVFGGSNLIKMSNKLKYDSPLKIRRLKRILFWSGSMYFFAMFFLIFVLLKLKKFIYLANEGKPCSWNLIVSTLGDKFSFVFLGFTIILWSLFYIYYRYKTNMSRFE